MIIKIKHELIEASRSCGELKFELIEGIEGYATSTSLVEQKSGNTLRTIVEEDSEEDKEKRG